MIGPVQKVLRELAAEIHADESGEISLSWHTSHGRRVVEIADTAPREPSAAVRTGEELIDYVALGLPSNATQAEVAQKQTPAKPAGNTVARAFKDAWLAVFPPKGRR